MLGLWCTGLNFDLNLGGVTGRGTPSLENPAEAGGGQGGGCTPGGGFLPVADVKEILSSSK